ncbi:Bestrophin, RFP-TM, chloride channel-domain-containing protein [Mrakia frigida]|uniref:Bestrophin, RFP-TM, chloride channel-domain-containing protein n=1 Tax=Mrakia frigida TaxID=29902 RepID=UPI003FCC19EC
MTTKPSINPMASIFGSREASSSSAQAKKPLTALAALVQAREEEKSKRTFSHVSWLPDVVRIKGSIIPSIAGPVSTVTLFAILVAGSTKFFNLPLRLSNSVVPLLSVVVGLLLVFRNGSAYERYSEGRKDFTALLSAARNLSRLIWIQVTLPSEELRMGKDLVKADGTKGKHVGPKEQMTREILKKDKIRFLKLVNAFSISTKHHLRGEPGTDYEDYNGVLPSDFSRFDVIASGYSSFSTSIPPVANKDVSPPSHPIHRTNPPLDLESQQPTGKNKKHVDKLTIKVARDVAGRALPSERTPLKKTHFIRKKSSYDKFDFMDRAYVSQEGAASLPLPLVIAHHLSRSVYKFKREGTLEGAGPAGVNAVQALIQEMVNQLGAMERVVRTPLPPVFTVHLKQCVLLYLFSLPLVLVDDMGWLMVFVVSLVAFTLMGIEGIAAEVENPFGTDQNDLPLDLELAELRVEIEYIFTRLPEGMDDDDVFAI